MMIKTEKESVMNKIIKMSKQLFEVAKYSPDMRKCVEVSVDQIIGNKELSQHCVSLGITKKDYIDFILKNF